MTARDVVYGRRGGRWAAKTPTRTGKPAKQAKAVDYEPCGTCGTAVPIPEPRPDRWRACCGHLHCRARLTWTAEQWAGRARMADARHHAGIPLATLDGEALDRRHQAARRTA